MRWNKEKLWYPICVPPLEKNLCTLTREEAQAYFDWFLGVLPGRVEYLRSVCPGLDGSPESLLPLWEWFLQTARIEKQPEHRFSLQTEYILRDVGMYLGDVFARNCPGIYWGFFTEPKTDVFVNTPVLMGFEDRDYTPAFYAVFEPIHMARVQAGKILRGQAAPGDLLVLYQKWTRMLPKEM